MAKKRRRKKSAMPSTRIALLLLLVLAGILVVGIFSQPRLAPSANQAGTPAGIRPTIRIGTWNLMQFSQNRRADLRTIARIIEDAKIDLLAIQEVKREGEQVDQLLNVLGPPWHGTISPMTGNYERYAFIYRSDVIQLLDKAQLIKIPQAKFDRLPATASFRAGNFDFVLITVHLFYSDTNRRKAEARDLAQYVTTTVANSAEKDFVVLGDFNEMSRGNHSGLVYFDTRGWRRLIDQTTNLGSTEVFDNILIDPRYTREYNGRSNVIFFDETLYGNDDKQAKSQVSDHRPAWAEFSTIGPDDD